MSYFPVVDTYTIMIPMNAVLVGSGGNYQDYYHTAGHLTAVYDYYTSKVDDYTDGAFDSEEVGTGSWIIPFASELIAVHFQYEDRESSTDTFTCVLAKCTEASGTGPNSTLSNAYTLTCANTTSEGAGYGHVHSATGLSVAFAQDDLLVPFLRRTENNIGGSAIDVTGLMQCVFKRTD